MKLENQLLKKIAETYGTPTYVYNLDLIKSKYNYFKAAFPWPDLRICYAMKANYNTAILNTMKSLGAFIDAVSPGDLSLALKCGFKPSQIIYTANNMKDAEVDVVMKTGVLMNIGSLSRLEKYAKKYPGTRVCIRFNPDVVDGEHDKIKTGGDLTKFGILLEDTDQVIRITKEHNLKVIGLHEHTGSGLIKSDSILAAMKNMMSIAKKTNFPDLEFMDFGGGFKIPYSPDEQPIDYKTMGHDIVSLFSNFCDAYGKKLGLYFEPGKFLTAQAGHLLVEVNTIKNNRQRAICGTDSGFPQLIRPMFYDAYHHIDNLSNPDGEKIRYDICGNICETGDLFARDRLVNKIREGDLLSINDAGAYCYSMGGFYNLRPMPAEVVVEKTKIRLSRKRLTPDELIALILKESHDMLPVL
ncbi:MAG: diaminopimelate decarboxylase [Proteobacteria bacterium]|nr:diaminopimelate decarboxylase [Pseudomonadota bacterium]MBU1581637.1 diaminopimelate decarboxylase [Pseudomonadota bacterium]MBU2453233.1 diaminopimelate decarboxylase [Pseudomonadota bacterium]MBU2631495.1 diaminopimelate decarboxylase [Pseudomonadota bacterium]